MAKIVMEKETLVFCAPVNEGTQRWGVYSIPRLWRLPSGEFVVCCNGEADHVEADARACPDLFFLSSDGVHWRETDGKNIDLTVPANVDSPYVFLPNGKRACIREKANRKAVTAPVYKRFSPPNGDGEHFVYKQGDLSKDEFACEFCTFDERGNLLSAQETDIRFPERELILFGGYYEDEKFVSLPVFVKPRAWSSPYIYSVNLLPDSTLVGVCFGQNPSVSDRYCAESYLVQSKDGITWTKRSTITKNATAYKYGLVGDGGESSLSIAPNGDMYCLTRTDMSIDHESDDSSADAMLFVSKDGGYTWLEGRSVADSSVTPHVLAFDNGRVAIVYGRPGVHIALSEDGGETFSAPVTVIGETLKEALASGKSYMQAKYYDMDSYSNTFVERTGENEFLLLYTDMKYDDGDRQRHKATLVRKIKII